MAEAAWKRDEKRVCRLLGAERSGPTGREGPDCTAAAPWAVQVKRSPRPQLPAKWLAQAERDASWPGFEGKPWVLVQACARRGRPTLLLATLAESELFALWEQAHPLQTRWNGHMLRRRCARPSLSLRLVEELRAAPQPWLLCQRLPDGRAFASLDFGELLQLGRLAGLVPLRPSGSEEA